jgi:serine/threonine protein kinase
MTNDASTHMTRLGNYELVRPLAQGGMADIYLARRAGVPFAIKVLNARRANDSEARALFHDEARLMKLLSHDNIAAAHELDAADGVHYLAMEYVHGVDLRELLAAAAIKHKRVDYAMAASIVSAAAAGLDHAHRRCAPDGRPLHLVHRDVSLSNIMVTYDGTVKVVDFGIASTSLSSVHTNPGTVRGKASYMSPEQCLGDPVDHRTDVFALGVVLYELTTGERCFHGKTDFERMLAVVRGDYIRPSELVPGYPVELEEIIRTALAIDMHQRYASAAAMIDAIAQVAAARGWAIGAPVLARMMVELYDDACVHVTADMIEVIVEPGPIAVTSDMIEAAAPLQEPEAPVPTVPELSQISRTIQRPPRLARGTQSDVMRSEPWRPVHEDDAPTRGRRSVPRIAA